MCRNAHQRPRLVGQGDGRLHTEDLDPLEAVGDAPGHTAGAAADIDDQATLGRVESVEIGVDHRQHIRICGADLQRGGDDPDQVRRGGINIGERIAHGRIPDGVPLCQSCCCLVSKVNGTLRRAEERTTGGIFRGAESICDCEEASVAQQSVAAAALIISSVRNLCW